MSEQKRERVSADKVRELTQAVERAEARMVVARKQLEDARKEENGACCEVENARAALAKAVAPWTQPEARP